MARARFGRLPRSAPSLTSTIVSLAQQYQGQRDRNIETAWKEGGLFEGKKVTDGAFMAHWKNRMKDVSKDDPMWDYYNNLMYSYDFTIEESKMGLKYAEESVSDTQMAAFYREWARKMPKDSQNYRQLMTQAAKFMSAANSRASQGRSQAAAKAYASAQQRTYDQNEKPYETTTSIIARYAVVAGYLDEGDLNDPDYGWSKLTNAAGENDPANFADLLSDIMGNPDIRRGMTAIIKASGDPDFSGTFNEETLARMANNARNGAQVRMTRAQKAGDKGGAKDASKAVDKYSKSAFVIRATLGPKGANNGFVEQNEFYRGGMDAVMSPNSGASPLERAAAAQRYDDFLAGDGMSILSRSFPAGTFDPLSDNFDPYAAGLMGRINSTRSSLNGTATGKTLKDDLYGFGVEKAGEGSDAVKLAGDVNGLHSALADVANGKSIVVRTNLDGKVDPNGTAWSIKDRSNPENPNLNLVPFAAPAFGTKVMPDGTVLGGDEGEIRYTQAVPVKAKVSGAIDPRTLAGTADLKVNPLLDETLGMMVELPGPGGQAYKMFGIYANGELLWTKDDPFKKENRGNEGRNGDDYVISFHEPGAGGLADRPTYNPGGFVPGKDYLKRRVSDGQGGFIDSTDGQAWDPNTDKETAFGSPMMALANTSTDAMKFVMSLGTPAVLNSEKAYYSDPTHHTPEMRRQIEAGADPAAVVHNQATNLAAQIGYNRQWGATPEAQQKNREYSAGVDARYASLASGKTPAQAAADVKTSEENAKRADLINQVKRFGISQRYPVGPTGSTGTWGADVKPEWQKKGWDVGDLLSQPGMSLEQANDLAFRITNGKYGRSGPVTPNAGPVGKNSGPKPYVNPFMPGGNLPPAPPGSPLKPKPKAVAPVKPPPPPPMGPHDLARVNPPRGPHDLARAQTKAPPAQSSWYTPGGQVKGG